MTDGRATPHRAGLASNAGRSLLLVLPVVLIFFVGALASGCGDGSPASRSTTAPPSTTASPADSTPPASETGGTATTPNPVTALADSIADTWAEAMQKLVVILQNKPEATAVEPEVAGLKEEYIQKLVGFGRDHAAMGAAEQQQVSTKIFTGISAFGSETWYTDYMALYEHYSTGDLDFANLLASFNILTQYADFELLKQQAPDEAARLGIE